MRDAVKILFDCAMEVRIPSYLTGNEYKNCTLALRREEKHFLSLLPPEEALSAWRNTSPTRTATARRRWKPPSAPALP